MAKAKFRKLGLHSTSVKKSLMSSAMAKMQEQSVNTKLSEITKGVFLLFVLIPTECKDYANVLNTSILRLTHNGITCNSERD